MRVRFRLLGSLRHGAGGQPIEVDVDAKETLEAVIRNLVAAHPSLAGAFQTPRVNLILLDGVEAGNLQGYGTQLRDGAEVTVIPVTHGG